MLRILDPLNGILKSGILKSFLYIRENVTMSYPLTKTSRPNEVISIYFHLKKIKLTEEAFA